MCVSVRERVCVCVYIDGKAGDVCIYGYAKALVWVYMYAYRFVWL